MEVESLKRELEKSNAEKNNLAFIIESERGKNEKLTENNLILSQQVRRYKRPNRFGVGPIAGIVMSKGAMIHPAAGVGVSFNIFSFGRF